MTFRVRKGFLSGNAILQMSDESTWVDVDPGELPPFFSIVSDQFLARLHRSLVIQDARIALYEKRAASARKGRAKKRAPVLTSVVDPVSTALGEKHR